MIVNTQRLFPELLSTLGIGVVCDVGSMNGADSLAFREAAPAAAIYAFEPNPNNLSLMQADAKLKAGNVEVVPLAASNANGSAEFFIVDADYSRSEARRGMSSLFER